MARRGRRYPPEFRREIVGLVRSGRSPEALPDPGRCPAAYIYPVRNGLPSQHRRSMDVFFRPIGQNRIWRPKNRR